MNRRGFMIRAGAASAASALAAPAIVRAASIMRVATPRLLYPFHQMVIGVDYAEPSADLIAYLEFIDNAVARIMTFPCGTIFDTDAAMRDVALLQRKLFS